MDTSNEVARLVAHFPMPRIKPLTLFCQSLGRMCLYSTNLTPSQVLPLPLLQSHCGTTLHCIHMLTSDATALITTSCVLFYFISPFLLLKLSRSCYHTHRHCMGTTTMVYTRGMTIQPCLQAHKPPRCHCILPLAPTPTTAIAPFVGMQVMFFFSFFFFVPFLTNITESLFTPH